jgi:hypothetical protein
VNRDTRNAAKSQAGGTIDLCLVMLSRTLPRQETAHGVNRAQEDPGDAVVRIQWRLPYPYEIHKNIAQDESIGRACTL